ncbi:transporter substrate-binding domain-containing protein, partial [Rhizobium ruizarguesonis]
KALPGVELKRLDLPWQGILPGLAASRFDYVVTSVTVTPERMKAYHLSAPIADATMAVPNLPVNRPVCRQCLTAWQCRYHHCASA